MLDFKRELQKYHDWQADFSFQSELSTAFELFAQEAKRFGKEQYKTTSQLEEILAQLEETTEQRQLEQDLRNQLAANSTELRQLLQGLLVSADCLEEIYRFSQKNAESSWQEQLALQWERLGDALSPYGLIRIEGVGKLYQPQLQVATSVVTDYGLGNRLVTEVIRSGYLYRGQLLRKADVIVNKLQESEA